MQWRLPGCGICSHVFRASGPWQPTRCLGPLHPAAVQVERLRQEMAANQMRELEELQVRT